MGSEISTTAFEAIKNETLTCEDPPAEETACTENPLQKFMSRVSHQPIQTLTGLDRKSQKNKEQVKKIIEVAYSDVYADPVVESDRLIKHEDENVVETFKRSRSAGYKTIAQFQKKDPTFKQLPIMVEQFINLREEPVADHFQFCEILGEGAYGQVYRAVCKKSG